MDGAMGVIHILNSPDLETPDDEVAVTAKMRSVFQFYDADRSGQIDRAELVAALQAMGFFLSAGELNQLLITVDDLRPEMGAYGMPQVQTPHLDKLFRGALTFKNACARRGNFNQYTPVHI